MAGFHSVPHTMVADVATSGTFTVGYPDGVFGAAFNGSYGNHKLYLLGSEYSVADGDFTVSFAALLATVTWLNAITIPAGSVGFAEFQTQGNSQDPYEVSSDRMIPLQTTLVTFGAVGTADADGICASQSGTAATAMTLDGALLNAFGDGMVMDVPRNVVAAWTGTAILTVAGEDEYGEVVVEKSASGTSLTGKKALKKITSVTPSANITSATVGTAAVLGLPAFIGNKVLIRGAAIDGVDEVATSTVVAGIATKQTATTGDVRGTIAFATAPNSTRVLAAVVAFSDPKNRGQAQYIG